MTQKNILEELQNVLQGSNLTSTDKPTPWWYNITQEEDPDLKKLFLYAQTALVRMSVLGNSVVKFSSFKSKDTDRFNECKKSLKDTFRPVYLSQDISFFVTENTAIRLFRCSHLEHVFTSLLNGEEVEYGFEYVTNSEEDLSKIEEIISALKQEGS
jgi:hypothetical protein